MGLPGPGSYDPRDEFIRPSSSCIKINPSKSITSNSFKDYLPGPGQYSPEKNSSNKKTIPKWTIGGKTNTSSLFYKLEKEHRDNPAPGNYDLNRSIGDGPKVIQILLKNI